MGEHGKVLGLLGDCEGLGHRKEGFLSPPGMLVAQARREVDAGDHQLVPGRGGDVQRRLELLDRLLESILPEQPPSRSPCGLGR